MINVDKAYFVAMTHPYKAKMFQWGKHRGVSVHETRSGSPCAPLSGLYCLIFASNVLIQSICWWNIY